MRIFSLVALTAFLFVTSSLKAQEFRANVTVNAPKLQKADPKIFKTLQQQISEFINDRKWSDNTYAQEERIEIIMQITIDEEQSDTRFKGQIAIQALRPVYNSNYNTVLLEVLDKDFVFEYQEYAALDFAEGQYFSNMTSVLGFYAYTILGLDNDSYSELGGTDYFNKAQQLMNAIPQNVSGSVGGWQPTSGQRNRYWLIENLLNVRMKTLRRAFYNYHRGGLDRLYEAPVAAQEEIKKALNDWKQASNDVPGTMIIQTVVNAKREEIIDVFSVADQKTKNEVIEIMLRLDATNAERYRKAWAF